MSLANPAPRALRALAPALLLSLGLPAMAQDLHADASSFNLFNDSSRVMIAFAVQVTGGDYTDNLLDTPMAPGVGRTLDLQGLLDDACDHKTRVVWEGGAEEALMVPYCTIATLALTDGDAEFR